MIISLSGKPGSGKSTIATRLAAELGFERIYIGGMRRAMARTKGMTLQEFNAWSETHPEGDKEFDAYITSVASGKDNIIIESRTAFHFLPQSLKIFLDVSVEEGARRIWEALQSGAKSDRNEAPAVERYEDVLASVRDRLRSDALRYRKYYQIDIFDPAQYDLFLDTTQLTPEQEYRHVYTFVREKLMHLAG
ncbi:MAG: cytidylate kinase family protein [Patescibacteria group bacterium]